MALGSFSASGVSCTPVALARASVTSVSTAAFLGGEALDRLDEVRDEVGAALVDVLHLRRLLVDVLLQGHQLVVDADAPDDEPHEQGQDDQAHDQGAHAA